MTQPDDSAPSGINSRVFVVALMLAIVGGTLAWNTWDLVGTEGLDPKAIKAMASTYDGECFKATQDERGCKRHIGKRHRECMKEAIVRKPQTPPAYVQSLYSACMLPHRDADLKAAARR